MRPSIRDAARALALPFVALAALASCSQQGQAPSVTPVSQTDKNAKKEGASLAADTSSFVPVNVSNFVRAETDVYFSRIVKKGELGKIQHERQVAPLDHQYVVRMNRDTLYSTGVFDLDAGPVAITLPDSNKRFMSMQVISEDHYAIDVVNAPASYNCTKERVGTRYAAIAIRTFADPRSPADIARASLLQDAVRVEQASPGRFEIPSWDPKSQGKVRAALEALGSTIDDFTGAFGRKEQVDPVKHLIGTATGWGGNPPEAAKYFNVVPAANDGVTVHKITVKDVPVDGFWSVTVYNSKGYLEKNDQDAYSLNNVTAKPEAGGVYHLQFGGCNGSVSNCLPIFVGWNYAVRLYRPRKEVVSGSWKFPPALPVK
ncbi:MAG: DUF1254 domain-containing protein [Polyangiaceae bacterium]